MSDHELVVLVQRQGQANRAAQRSEDQLVMRLVWELVDPDGMAIPSRLAQDADSASIAALSS